MTPPAESVCNVPLLTPIAIGPLVVAIRLVKSATPSVAFIMVVPESVPEPLVSPTRHLALERGVDVAIGVFGVDRGLKGRCPRSLRWGACRRS